VLSFPHARSLQILREIAWQPVRFAAAVAAHPSAVAGALFAAAGVHRLAAGAFEWGVLGTAAAAEAGGAGWWIRAGWFAVGAVGFFRASQYGGINFGIWCVFVPDPLLLFLGLLLIFPPVVFIRPFLYLTVVPVGFLIILGCFYIYFFLDFFSLGASHLLIFFSCLLF
jgi:hypothetical protein